MGNLCAPPADEPHEPQYNSLASAQPRPAAAAARLFGGALQEGPAAGLHEDHCAADREMYRHHRAWRDSQAWRNLSFAKLLNER